MAKVTQAAAIGLFLVVAAGATYLVTKTIGPRVRGGKGYVVHSYLRDASGIAKNSRVTIAGIAVGQVEDIRLENGRARIDVRMSPEVVLHRTATLGVKSASLLGENVVVLSEGFGDPAKQDGDELQTLAEGRSLEDLKESVGRISDLIEKVAVQLASSMGTDEAGAHMSAILRNLAQASEAIDDTIRENRNVLHSTLQNVDEISRRSSPELQKILSNVRSITDDVKELLSSSSREGFAGLDGGVLAGGQPPQGGELRSAAERISRASKSLESALSHIDSIAERIDRGEGTVGRLTKDDDLVTEVQGVAEGVNEYVASLRRLQTVVGLRSDYNFSANTVKSYVELRLQPREDKYYLVEFINDPRGKTTITQTDTDTTNPNDPPHYRTVTTSTTDAFRFTVQFARRLGPFTGRFGIKESTGGIGLDTHLFSNRLEIVQDLFGFGEELRPRYRLYAGFELLHRLWLLGGADHIVLADRRDYFLGLQLRFTDDDLKTILPFVGSSAPTSK